VISSLRGVLHKIGADQVVVDVGGVGYGVRTPLSTLYELETRGGGLAVGSPVELLIHTQVREDAIELFGFLTELELQLFELLVSVSGIGPRLAQGVLSGLAPREVATALAQGDVARLVLIPGIGKKTAERMVLELREKVGKQIQLAAPESEQGRLTRAQGNLESDAVGALLGLGYRPHEAERAVAAAWREAQEEESGSEQISLQELLRSALRRLAKV
jgi:Holliday junction DNA helicase RuvA